MALKNEQISGKYKVNASPQVRRLVKASVTRKIRRDKSFLLEDCDKAIPKYKGWAY
jgi:hypothetical protein